MTSKYKQIDTRDCSLYVFKYFLENFKDKHVNIDELKFQTTYDENGVSLSNFDKIINLYNWSIEVYETEYSQLVKLDKTELPFGAIVRLNNYEHMVLITNKSNSHITYYDPNIGKENTLEFNEFQSIFRGLLIEFIEFKNVKNEVNEVKDNKNKGSYFSLFEFNKEHLYITLMLMLELIFLIVLPLINKKIINTIIVYKLKNEILLIGISSIIMIVILYLIQNITNRITNIIYNKKVSEIFIYLLNQFNISNKKMALKLSTLEIKNRFASIYEILSIKQMFFPSLIINILSFSISLLILKNINNIMLIILGALGIFILILSFIKKKIFDSNFHKILTQNFEGDLHFENYVNSIKEFEHHILSNSILSKWTLSNEKFVNQSLEYNKKLILVNSLNSLIEIITPLVICLVGANEIWENRLELPNFIYFLTSLNLFIKPLKGFFENISGLINFRAKVKLTQVFYQNKKEYQPSLKNFINKIKTLKVSYVDFSYPNSNKIINIDRMIFQDKVKLIGRNGSGKSTLSKILVGLLPSDKGEIMVNDQIIELFNNEDLKEKMCYLNSELSTIKTSILEYLGINDFVHLKAIIKKYQLDLIFKDINFDIENINWKNVNELSKGQIAIIKILKIFLNDYDVIIFDESFENLNQNVFKTLKEVLQEYLNDKLVIEISHTDRYIFQNASEVILNEI
ncbi:Mbov_0121 family peptidase domain-containing ABC transporter [Mycoplasmopsis edwardii]|nr:ATP-binding cassette domain-containing protein [Mycoplasmopsis edwardii]